MTAPESFIRGTGTRVRVVFYDINGDPMTNVTGATFYVVPGDEADSIANAIGPDNSNAYSWALTYNAAAVDEDNNDAPVAGAHDGTLPQEVGAIMNRSKSYRVVPLKSGLISSAPYTFSVR